MSTWISSGARGAGRAALVAGPLALALAGCVADGFLPLSLPLSAQAAAPAKPTPPLILAKAVRVAVPRGWCPDPRAGMADDTGGFVLVAPCRGGPVPPAPAILTLSVLGGAEAGAVTPDRLDAFFRSEIGRGALSRSGKADSVTILQTGIEGDAYFLHVRDSADLGGVRVAPDAWRAVLPLAGRLVALTALSPEEPALPPATLRAVLDAFVAEMRAANGAETG